MARPLPDNEGGNSPAGAAALRLATLAFAPPLPRGSWAERRQSILQKDFYTPAAKAFLESLSPRDDVDLSEFVLSEVYLHLRNPAVLDAPLSPAEAVAVIQSYRQHPRWRVLGFPPRSRALHTALWKAAAAPDFARRRIYDLRIALCLQAFGVTDFATANVQHFEDTGFARVWNPLSS